MAVWLAAAVVVPVAGLTIRVCALSVEVMKFGPPSYTASIVYLPPARPAGSVY